MAQQSRSAYLCLVFVFVGACVAVVASRRCFPVTRVCSPCTSVMEGHLDACERSVVADYWLLLVSQGICMDGPNG
ncbi:hypothetical protein LX32DRAFT_643537, partial [Colletotrichum zoysiae]